MTGSVMDGVSWQDGPKAQAIAADDVLKAEALRRVKLAATALLAFCGLLFLSRKWEPKHPAVARLGAFFHFEDHARDNPCVCRARQRVARTISIKSTTLIVADGPLVLRLPVRRGFRRPRITVRGRP